MSPASFPSFPHESDETELNRKDSPHNPLRTAKQKILIRVSRVSKKNLAFEVSHPVSQTLKHHTFPTTPSPPNNHQTPALSQFRPSSPASGPPPSKPSPSDPHHSAQIPHPRNPTPPHHPPNPPPDDLSPAPTPPSKPSPAKPPTCPTPNPTSSLPPTSATPPLPPPPPSTGPTTPYYPRPRSIDSLASDVTIAHRPLSKYSSNSAFGPAGTASKDLITLPQKSSGGRSLSISSTGSENSSGNDSSIVEKHCERKKETFEEKYARFVESPVPDVTKSLSSSSRSASPRSSLPQTEHTLNTFNAITTFKQPAITPKRFYKRYDPEWVKENIELEKDLKEYVFVPTASEVVRAMREDVAEQQARGECERREIYDLYGDESDDDNQNGEYGDGDDDGIDEGWEEEEGFCEWQAVWATKVKEIMVEKLEEVVKVVDRPRPVYGSGDDDIEADTSEASMGSASFERLDGIEEESEASMGSPSFERFDEMEGVSFGEVEDDENVGDVGNSQELTGVEAEMRDVGIGGGGKKGMKGMSGVRRVMGGSVKRGLVGIGRMLDGQMQRAARRKI